MPVSSDIENTNLTVGFHGNQAVKALPAKTMGRDAVRRKPLGTVNFQNAQTNTGFAHKNHGSEKKSLCETLGEKVSTNANKLQPMQSRGQAVHGSKISVIVSSVLANEEVEEKEAMHISRELDDDDFRDLWSICEQPATYLKNVMSWQPPVSSRCAAVPQVSPPSFSEADTNLVSFDGSVIDFNLMSLTLPPLDEDLDYLSSFT